MGGWIQTKVTGILAIETATDACSVAVYRGGEYRERHALVPRLHSQRLFPLLRELLSPGDLGAQGIDAIAYGCGPGSFTGLRIAASAVQGLAFTAGLPCIGVSTLLCLAQTALREAAVQPEDTVLATLDARLDELYYAPVAFRDSVACLLEPPRARRPGELELSDAGDGRLQGIGSGMRYAQSFPAPVRDRLQIAAPDQLPAARDLVPAALAAFAAGATVAPREVVPVYVRDEINWKKIAQQGPPG